MEQLAKIDLDSNNVCRDKSTNLQKLVSSSRLDGLKVALAEMAYVRGGEMTANELVLYSTAIATEFPDGDHDVLAVLDRLRRFHEEYERTVPSMPILLTMMRRHRSERLRIAREVAEREREAAKWRHRREYPEEYVSMGEIYAEVLARIAAKQESANPKRVAEPSEQIAAGG
jgi:hypothetical protein